MTRTDMPRYALGMTNEEIALQLRKIKNYLLTRESSVDSSLSSLNASLNSLSSTVDSHWNTFLVDHLSDGSHSLSSDLAMNSNFLKALEGIKDANGNTRIIIVEEGDDIKSKIENAPEGALIFICQGTYTFTDTINPPNGVHLLGANKHHTILNFKPSSNNIPAFYWYKVDYRFAASNFTLQYDDSIAGAPTWGAYGFRIRYAGAKNLFAFSLQHLIIKKFFASMYWAGDPYHWSSMFVFDVAAVDCPHAGFRGGGWYSLFLDIMTAKKDAATDWGIYFINQFGSVVSNFITYQCGGGIRLYSNAGDSTYFPGTLFTNGVILEPNTGIYLETWGSGTDLRCLRAPRVTNVRISNCRDQMVWCSGVNDLGYIKNIVLEGIEHFVGSGSNTTRTPTYGLYIDLATEIHFDKVVNCDFSQASTPVYVADPSKTNWDSLEYKEVKV